MKDLTNEVFYCFLLIYYKKDPPNLISPSQSW